jgi:glycosyltransferase involved in cell wall biosynthesis
MHSILFFDSSCPRPYSTRTLLETGLGGTEATVVRIAEAIGAFVMQHNRTEPEGRYLPPGTRGDIDHVVLLRDPRHLAGVRKLFPQAKIYLWVHDRIEPASSRARWFKSAAGLLQLLEVTIICVSHYQRRGVQAVVDRLHGHERIRVLTVYNPIDDDLFPDDTPIDPSKLVFFSSPSKGLPYALDVFRALRRRMPDLRLVVANPGYKKWRPLEVDGVCWLGALPHKRILEEARAALCTFLPNFRVPETFGLVLAESNALGTPVLTHACGAADEVLNDPQQTLPVTSAQRIYHALTDGLPPRWRTGPARLADCCGVFDVYAERIRRWREGERPVTRPDPRFRLNRIADEWREVFTGVR